MLKVRKKVGNEIQAWQLGTGTKMEQELIDSGKMLLRNDGKYEVFTHEATENIGELAKPGDYVKIDTQGRPYPNREAFFQENHVQTGENVYTQTPRALDAWTVEEPMCEEIRFLMEKKGLVLNPENAEKYFQAPLWGTLLTAREDAVLVFYSIERDTDGNIVEAEFNFVEREEFIRTYQIAE